VTGHEAGLIACTVLTVATVGGLGAAFAMAASRKDYGCFPVLALAAGGTCCLWAAEGWLIWLGVQP
jgi:hypothetical protein